MGRKEGNMMEHNREKLLKSYQASKSLLIYRNIAMDEMVQKWQQIITMCLQNEDPFSILGELYDWAGRLMEKVEELGISCENNVWQEYLIELILAGENVFSRRSAHRGRDSVPQALHLAVKNDLRHIQNIGEISFEALVSILHENHPVFDPPLPLPSLPSMCCSSASLSYHQAKQKIKEAFSASIDWGELAEKLSNFYQTAGYGKFAKYRAFIWTEEEMGGTLTGVAHPDPIRLTDLAGYELQKEELLRNTRQFLQGYGANNILLYGDRGTGKSSMIKALIHEFDSERLRLVEVQRHQLRFLSRIIREIRTEPYYFIIFIDDLSFEAQETEYKFLKAALEGSVEKTPDNVVVYATSNRRHLVQEFFVDRHGEEVHVQDARQEKLSLSDRFGITLVFAAPDQEQYLQIVEHLARQNNISLSADELNRQALRWAMWHNCRSGRTASQFIRDLLGQKKTAASSH